jgi:hypothetical protein
LRNISIFNIATLAHAFGVSIGELFPKNSGRRRFKQERQAVPKFDAKPFEAGMFLATQPKMPCFGWKHPQRCFWQQDGSEAA